MPRRDVKRKRPRSQPPHLLEGYLRHRFAWLFLSLLLTLGAAPVLRALVPNFPLELLLAVTLVTAIASAAHERWIQLLLLLGAAFLLTRGIQVLTGAQALLSLSQVLWVLAALLATATAVRHAMRAGPVNAERIFAALDAYLLAGLIFGICYWLTRPDLACIIRSGNGEPACITSGHLFQLRDDRDAGIWRHCSSQRLGARNSDPRGGERAALSRGARCQARQSLCETG